MEKKVESKELAVPLSFDLATIAKGSESVQENLDQIDIKLSTVKILHQAVLFELPNGNKVMSFRGLLIDFNKCQSYWPESFDKQSGVPPTCFSLDAVRPSPYSEKLMSDFCAECEKNKFGSSEKGKGRACKSSKRLHVIAEKGQLLPWRLVLSPANLKPFDKYISSLVSRGFPWRLMVHEFSLKSTKNRDGVAYSEIVIKDIGEITQEEAAISKKVASQLMPILRDRDIKNEDIQ